MTPRKIGIVIGHNERAQGAVRATDGTSEYVWNGRLAEMIRALNPDQVRIFRRKSQPNEIRACYAEVDAWGADVTCELHFNAAAAPSATGTETLYATNAGKAVAERVQAAMVKALGLRDRGLLERKTGNGATSLLAGRAPAVLIEPYFGSNPADCRVADARMADLADAVFRALGGDRAARVSGGAGSPAPSAPPANLTPEQRLDALEARMDAMEGRP